MLNLRYFENEKISNIYYSRIYRSIKEETNLVSKYIKRCKRSNRLFEFTNIIESYKKYEKLSNYNIVKFREDRYFVCTNRIANRFESMNFEIIE